MSTSRAIQCYFVLCLVAICLTACSAASQVARQFSPTPSHVPDNNPFPPSGQVGQRVEWGGWAVTVSNVLRSSLNPRERVPGNYHPDEWDYIGMDVTVERTVDERGFVYGEDFSLVDSAGNVYDE